MVVVSAIEFFYLVRKRKPRIINSYDAAEIVKITDENKKLAAVVALEPSLKEELEKVSKKSFNQAWKPAGNRFSSLRRLSAGLASVMPTTSGVKAGFYFIYYLKSEYNTSLSDFSLEGVHFFQAVESIIVGLRALTMRHT